MLLGAPRPGGGGGWDRGRVGERLQAALAGLRELQVLREQQRDLVRAALAMPQRGPAAGGEQPLCARSKERRLEATLSALKEQLVRDGTGSWWPPGVRRGALAPRWGRAGLLGPCGAWPGGIPDRKCRQPAGSPATRCENAAAGMARLKSHMKDAGERTAGRLVACQ